MDLFSGSFRFWRKKDQEIYMGSHKSLIPQPTGFFFPFLNILYQCDRFAVINEPPLTHFNTKFHCLHWHPLCHAFHGFQQMNDEYSSLSNHADNTILKILHHHPPCQLLALVWFRTSCWQPFAIGVFHVMRLSFPHVFHRLTHFYFFKSLNHLYFMTQFVHPLNTSIAFKSA